MKKVMLAAVVLLMAACPVACVNDPTDSEQTCVEASDSTDTVDACVIDTSTETVVE